MSFNWNPALHEGAALRDGGDLPAAEAKLREGLALSPQSAAGHSALAAVLARLGRTQEALAEARLAVQHQDESQDYHGQLAALLEQSGDLAGAEAACRAALQRNATDPDLTRRLGQVLRQQARRAQDRGDWAEAAPRWEELAARAPEDRDAHKHGIAAWRRLDRNEDAERVLGHLVDRFPDEVQAAIEYAEAAAKRRDWRAATQRWDVVIARAPDLERAYAEKAETLGERKLYHEIESFFEAAMERFPDSADLAVRYGFLALRHGRLQEAADRFDRMCERFPHEAAGYMGAAEARVIAHRTKHSKEYKEADKILATGVGRLPDDPVLLFRYAQMPIHHALLSGHDRNLALKRLAILRERFPKFEPGYIATAQCLRAEHRPAEAEDVLRQGLERAGATRDQMFEYARLAQDRADWPAAAERFKAVAEKFPDLLRGRLGLGHALMQLTAFDDADTVLEATMRKFPNELAPATDHAEVAMARQDWPTALQRWQDVYRRFPGQQDAAKMVAIVERKLRPSEVVPPATGSGPIFAAAPAPPDAASTEGGFFSRLRGMFSARPGTSAMNRASDDAA